MKKISAEQKEILDRVFDSIPVIEEVIRQKQSPDCDCIIDSITERFSNSELTIVKNFTLAIVAQLGLSLIIRGPSEKTVIAQTEHVILIEHINRVMESRVGRVNSEWEDIIDA